MAEVTVNYPTLVDVTSAYDPQGRISKVAEILSKNLPILRDIPIVEGNLATGHQIVSRTALPSPTWRMFNEGVVPTLATQGPVTEAAGICEAHHNIDIALARRNGNSEAWRLQQDAAFGEGISQDIATGIFYYNRNVPNKFFGLAPRYLSTSGTTGSYCLKAGTTTTTDCYSIWLINWSPNRVYGFFPKGAQGGLQMKDHGEVLVTTNATTGAQLWVYQTQWVWEFGLAVEDYRYCVRGVIDSGDATVWAATTSGITNLMDSMAAQIYSTEGSPRWYMNRTVYGQFLSQLNNKNTNGMSWMSDGGRMVPAWLGIPIRISDSLVSETVYTGVAGAESYPTF